MKHLMLAAAIALAAVPAEAQGLNRAKAGPQDRKSRPFYMGATPMPHDMTPEGLAALMAFLNSHTDLVSVKIDGGLPWQEAFDRRSYTPEYERSIEEKVPKLEQKKVFLSLTPFNGDKNGLAPYAAAKEGDPRAAAWRAREMDEPNVIRAYANFCRDMIVRFRPDFLAYAVEANAAAKNAQAWKKFLVLAKEVYTSLKREYPTLPIFVTLHLEAAYEPEQVSIQRKAITQVLAYSDLVAVIAIPYYREANPAKLPRDYFSQIAGLAPGKPFAVAETAFLAEDLSITGLERTGKPAWQQDYVKFLFEEGARLNAKFVVWMVPRDYDDLWEKVQAQPVLPSAAEFYKLFKDTGLIDGKGNPRKAFETWQQWFKLPRK